MLVYIDESGSPEFSDNSEIYCESAILIREADYQQIDNRFDQFRLELKNQYKVSKDIEIHIRKLLGNPSKDDMGAYEHLSFEKRKEIYLKICEFISILTINCISVVFFKPELNKNIDTQVWADLFLFERIQMCTQENKGDYAILFVDSINEQVNKIRLNRLRKVIYNPYKLRETKINFRSIVPTIYFIDSSSSIGIQLADVIGYCIRRFLRWKVYKKETAIDILNYKCFNLIKDKFHKKSDLIGKGLKIFPKELEKTVKKEV